MTQYSFKRIFATPSVDFSHSSSAEFDFHGPNDNKILLVKVMVLSQTTDKPLPNSMATNGYRVNGSPASQHQQMYLLLS